MKTFPEHPPSVEAAQAMYARYLSGWVLDLSRLRRKGLETPGPRRSTRLAAWPGDAGAVVRSGRQTEVRRAA